MSEVVEEPSLDTIRISEGSTRRIRSPEGHNEGRHLRTFFSVVERMKRLATAHSGRETNLSAPILGDNIVKDLR